MVERQGPEVPFVNLDRIVPSDSRFQALYGTHSDESLRLMTQSSMEVLEDYIEIQGEPLVVPEPVKLLD